MDQYLPPDLTKQPQIDKLAAAGLTPLLRATNGLFREKNKTSQEDLAATLDFIYQQLFTADRVLGSEKIIPRHNYVTQAILTLGIAHRILNCDTTSNAVALNLPEAKSVIGQEYIIVFGTKGGSNNVTITSASGDVFQGAGGAGNDVATMDTANEYMHIVAAGDNLWLVLSHSGVTFS